MYKSCTCFVIFITKYFIIFGAIINGIVLFIFGLFIASVSNYRIDFCISILYPISLPYSFISSIN